jgi:hypothetical protein
LRRPQKPFSKIKKRGLKNVYKRELEKGCFPDESNRKRVFQN